MQCHCESHQLRLAIPCLSVSFTQANRVKVHLSLLTRCQHSAEFKVQFGELTGNLKGARYSKCTYQCIFFSLFDPCLRLWCRWAPGEKKSPYLSPFASPGSPVRPWLYTLLLSYLRRWRVDSVPARRLVVWTHEAVFGDAIAKSANSQWMGPFVTWQYFWGVCSWVYLKLDCHQATSCINMLFAIISNYQNIKNK